MTSSPGPISMASRTRTIASVPLATPTARSTPRYAAASSWNAQKCDPRMNWPPSRTSRNRASSSGISGAYCALTSISGIGDTATTHCSPAVEEIRHDQHEACGDDVVDVAERVVGVGVRRAEGPARGRQAEAEDGRAKKREREELPERHPHDPGRDRDEGAGKRSGEADRNSPVVVALEPVLGPLELRLGHVEEAAVPQHERAPAEVADPPAERGADDVADRSRDDDGDVGPGMRVHSRAEHVDRYARERPARDGAGVEHHELARHRQHSRDDEQPEDRVDAVVADSVGDRPGEAAEQHGPEA